MAFQELLAQVRTLALTVHALAAVGAELQLEDNETEGDVRVRSLLKRVVRTIDPELVNGLTREQRLLAEPADSHVLEHAAAKIGDGLLAHRVLLS